MKPLLSLLLLSSLAAFGQLNDEGIRQLVLSEGNTDSLYVFGSWNVTDGTETHLQYLGSIYNEQSEWKIMNSVYYWGLSKRATSRVLIYDQYNNYLGNYNIGNACGMPERIENNQILFSHSSPCSQCDPDVVTFVSFENGIPDEFFVECKDGQGDFYSFY